MKRIGIITIGLLCAGMVQAQTLERQVLSSNGGYDTNGDLSLEWTMGEIAVKTYTNGNLVITEGYEQGTEPCSGFDTAPVDLTKSFDPVDGIRDRVQVKWYKDSPQIKYTVQDNAACDIEYWAYRYKDNPEDPWINIPPAERDTSRLPYTTVKKNNNKPLFKWPLKFRLNNGNNQVLPNRGYRWRVRCYCDHGDALDEFGDQIITPWSEVRFFNTPDFDPETGIYTPPEGTVDEFIADKSMEITQADFVLYPNPTVDIIHLNWTEHIEGNLLAQILDANGKLVFNELLNSGSLKEYLVDMSSFSKGTYHFILSDENGDRLMTRQVVKME